MDGLRGGDHVHAVTRQLRSRCEAIYGAVFWAPEARGGALGLDTIQWYMAGRIAALGPVTAQVATALFGTFDPRRVRDGLDGVWAHVVPEPLLAARLGSAVGFLGNLSWSADVGDVTRAVGLLSRGVDAAEVAGHPLYAALAARPRPSDPISHLWVLCELVREHRSAAHVNAWRTAGLDPVEVNVLNELWRAVPTGSIAHVDMGWGHEDIAAAMARVVSMGLAADGRITPAGHDLREDIERRTSAHQASIVDALGDDAPALLDLLHPWARATADSRR